MVHDMIILLCSAVHGFWLMEESAELVEGPTGCVEEVRSGCLVFICLELQCDKA